MVKETSTYLRTLEDKDRFTTWFGAYSWFRYFRVASHFKKISSAYFASYTYDCTCKDPAIRAFVNIDLEGTIYICPPFWDNRTVGAQAGTLVHEVSHFKSKGGCVDVIFGELNCILLAIQTPSRTTYNADSHKFLAMSFLPPDT
jgi:peptidyl-Lys metalloendopeptidase